MKPKRRVELIGGLLATMLAFACGQKSEAAPAQAVADGDVGAETAPAMKTVQIVDPILGVRAFSVTIPATWVYDGTVLRPHFGTSMVLRTSSPDGLTGLQIFPKYNWLATSDPSMQRFYQNVDVRKMGPMKADEYLRKYVLPEIRSQATVVGPEPMPQFHRLAENDARQNAEFATQSQRNGRRAPHVMSDAARYRIQYDFNGHPEDESIVVLSSVTDIPEANGTTRLSEATATGARAPRGQLDGRLQMLTAIANSIKVDPEWVQKQTQFALQNAQAQQRAILSNADSWRRRNQAVFEASMKNTAAMEKARHDGAVATADHMGDVQEMVDPSTGETGKVSNQFNYSYVDENGNVVHTNSATYNPNAELRGNWTQLQPLKP